ARRSLTRATSTKSKPPAQITKFSSCRSAAAHQRKFPQVLAASPRHFILQTENISPGARKRAAFSKPINGGFSCRIDNRGTRAKSLKPLSIRSEASAGHPTQVKSSSRQRDVALLR